MPGLHFPDQPWNQELILTKPCTRWSDARRNAMETSNCNYSNSTFGQHYQKWGSKSIADGKKSGIIVNVVTAGDTRVIKWTGNNVMGIPERHQLHEIITSNTVCLHKPPSMHVLSYCVHRFSILFLEMIPPRWGAEIIFERNDKVFISIIRLYQLLRLFLQFPLICHQSTCRHLQTCHAPCRQLLGLSHPVITKHVWS